MSLFRRFLVVLLSTATLVFGSEQPKARIVRSVQTAKRSAEVEYHVHIKEKGVHFNETMRINTRDNTVFFSVPAHNDVGRSEVLMDYNLNLTITRLPDLGICHIKPLDRVETSPNKMNEDMEQASLKKSGRTTRRGVLSTSTEWAIDKLLKQNDLSLSVRRFCAGLRVFSLKKIDEDDIVVEEQSKGINGGKTRKKRQANFQLCNRSYGSTPCNPNVWILRCKFVRAGSTCVYWITCQLPVAQINRDLQNCGARHDWSSVLCCNPVCP